MENREELMDAILGGDDEPILPDGWKEGDDLFADAEDDSLFGADGSEGEEKLEAENEGGDAGTDDPTTVEDTDNQNGQSAEGEEEPENPDGGVPEEAKPSRVLKLKVNHTEEDLDINAMSDEELVALLQKGRAFDAMRDAENKKRYRAVYQEQIDAGMTEAAAKLVAQNEVGGKVYPLEDTEENAPAEERPSVEEATPRNRDFRAEVEQLRALFPEVTEIPDEVARAAARGVDMVSAYLALKDRRSAETVAKLRKENQILRQNAASAAKAPVRGVSGGGAVQKKEDPALKGFDLEQW